MTSRLNAPYGGTLVERVVSGAHRAGGSDALTLDRLAEMDLMNIALGSFSPLTGFMGSRDFEAVCRRGRLASRDLVWTIPVVLDIGEPEADRITVGREILLKSETSDRVVGFMVPSEIYPHDKDLRITGTFGVTSDEHPGVELVRAMKPWLLAGDVWVFDDVVEPESVCYPAVVREKLEAMGRSTVAGFHTRNVVHRAHEYLQRLALELTGGLLIQPIVGWGKPGDFRPEIVQAAYARFIDAYYPKDRVLLAFLKTPARFAGPREAVFHAIVRKNFGCSHFIVGRDHAGVRSFYGVYDAHKIFETLPDLGITILKFHEPFYCQRCQCVATELTCGHGDAERQYISGTAVRTSLQSNREPSDRIFRPEVLAYLREHAVDEIFYE